ncbi:uncharacterized protein LOC132601403 [Lycium barbarum]|uniref:uncharacterized protein LOC132601403 n=1 Tax=Lycium barbarum TaxID=112863 RepID=UPI00293F22E9|nr:uncharacterized protein LOC132601403 [Lycium barbarum]
MECIETVSYSFVINGGLAQPFKGKRGIMQGDPMSPYLFVLGIEYLQREMNQPANNPKFNFHPRCKRMKLFSNASGVQEKLDKISLYITGVFPQVKEDIFLALGYVEGSLPFKYLGVPLSPKKLSVSYLLRQFLFGMQTYWAQIVLLPKKVMKLIDAVCRSFLWTGMGKISKKALVSWEKICQPQAAGGLNVIHMGLWNKAVILKQLCAISQNKTL